MDSGEDYDFNRETQGIREELKEVKERADKSAKEIEQLKQEVKELKERLSAVNILHPEALEKLCLLNRTNIKFSKSKYNAEMVHINAMGELMNLPHRNPPNREQRLKNYRGTRSTFPLPLYRFPQYYEVETRVDINERLSPLSLLLEIGLAADGDQDQSNWIGGQPNSYSLSVQHCSIHNSVCRHVRRHGEHVTCLTDTMENKPRTSVTLHYGIVYDCARSLIAFLDVKNEKIIGKIEKVDGSVALWPMFGVNNTFGVNLRMSLIVGADIEMTDAKKSFIHECYCKSHSC